MKLLIETFGYTEAELIDGEAYAVCQLNNKILYICGAGIRKTNTTIPHILALNIFDVTK